MSDEEDIREEEILASEEAIENELVDKEDLEVDNEIETVDNEEVVERAKKFGHLSREEWEAAGKDPAAYKSPEEFDKTGKILDQLYSMRKKVDQRDREIQALVDYQQRTSQREYDKAKQELEQRLAGSKDDMDVEGVAHYTKELVKLQGAEEHSHVQKLQQLQQQAQQAFMERNEHWFNDRNPDLKQRAIEIDNELKGIYPNATYDELARKIESRMQYEHPERVQGNERSSRPVVSSGNSSINKTAVKTSSVSRTFQGLSQDLKDTYSATKRIVESRGDKEYTVNDFINQLKKDGEIK